MDPDWQVTCRQLYLGDELERWLALGMFLSNRIAWHFEVQDTMDPTLWCFGLAGECRLVATLEASGGIHLYDHDNDGDYSFTAIGELGLFLGQLEGAPFPPLVPGVAPPCFGGDAGAPASHCDSARKMHPLTAYWDTSTWVNR